MRNWVAGAGCGARSRSSGVLPRQRSPDRAPMMRGDTTVQEEVGNDELG